MTTTCRTSGTASKTKRACRNNRCKNTEAFAPSRRGRVPGGAFPDARAAGGDGCTIEPGAGPAFSVEGRGPAPRACTAKGGKQMDERTILCPYCRAVLEEGAEGCPHCKRSFAGRNPTGALPVGTLLAGRYTVGDRKRVVSR